MFRVVLGSVLSRDSIFLPVKFDIVVSDTSSLLFQVHKGVRGIVRDKSGKPIVGAMIVLNGGVRVLTGKGGYFHALLAPGSHNIEAVAEGYQQQRQEVRKKDE